ncbi:GNAT family N-acetyltransferase [Paramicrobacterium humi]|nr:GNAT family N-acetyltransferase [Microbacterium humi]
MADTSAPLQDRVTAPAELPLPQHPDVATWRPAKRDDLDDIMTMLDAVRRADHPAWSVTRTEIDDAMGSSMLDLATDSLLALDESGTVIAFGIAAIAQGQATRVQVYLDGAVHPDWRGRGIGRLLLAWQRDRSLQLLAASDKPLPGWSMLHEAESNVPAQHLAERAGFTLTRYFTQMVRRLDEPIEPIPAKADVQIVPLSADLIEATRVARNDAFRDHWGSQPMTVERWGHLTSSPEFRNDLSRVAVVPGEDGSRRVVAFALTSVNESDWDAAGYAKAYIEYVGVVRDHRGQRLAPAVIAAALQAHKSAGIERSELDVDSDSPTGANTLYQSMGFSLGDRDLSYVLEV